MAVPYASTTVSIYGYRPQRLNDPDADGYDPDPSPPPLLDSGVRATITLPGAEPNSPHQTDTFAFRCDPTDIERFDFVVDETTMEVYELREVRTSIVTDFGLEHHIGTLVKSKGVINIGR